MQSVNPASFSQGMTSDPQSNVANPQANSPDLSSGQFGVNNPSTPSSPMPQSNPITQNANSISTDMLTQATRQGDQAVSQAAASSGGGGGGGGDIFGQILGIGSKILPFLAQGGPVGLAQGGMPDTQGMDPTAAMSLGYLVGALHQRDYNGSPDTLTKAAEQVKQRLTMSGTQEPASPTTAATNNVQIGREQSPYTGTTNGMAETKNSTIDLRNELGQKGFKGFASGGDVSADTNLAQQSLMQALGLNNTQQGSGNSNNQAQAAQPMQQQPQPTPETQPTPTQPQQNGFMQGLAMGGPPMGAADPSQGGPPPLQPGQTFQGDGSVKGPGGPQDDAIPAKLSNGEFVFSQPAVQFFGVDKLVKMNDQGKQGFMQAIGQVQANQQQGPQGPPGAGQPPQATTPQAPPSMPPQQPPMMQARGGLTTSPTMRNKAHGYMGI